MGEKEKGNRKKEIRKKINYEMWIGIWSEKRRYTFYIVLNTRFIFIFCIYKLIKDLEEEGGTKKYFEKVQGVFCARSRTDAIT